MNIKINYNSIYIYSILFLVSGMSIIEALDFLYEISFNNVYNTIFAIIFFLFIIGLFSNKLKLLMSNYIKLFIIFFIVVSLSYFLNYSSEFSNRKYFLFFGGGLLLTLFSSAIKPDMYKYLPHSIVFFALVNAIIILGYSLKLDGITELRWTMITQVETDLIYITRSLGLSIITVFFYLKNKLFKILILLVLFYLMLILNEVGPLLAVIISFFFYYSRKNSFYIFLSMLGGVIMYFFVIQQFIHDLTLDEILNDPRVEIYTKSFNYFLNRPFFGIGIGGTAYFLNSYQSAHNIFLEIASEFGVVALIPFIGMVILLIKKYLVNKEYPLSYLWLYSFIVVQFSGDIGLNTIYWFISAIFISVPIIKSHPKSTQFRN